MDVKGFSRIALSVADAARSVRFYAEALGFELGVRHELGAEFQRAGEGPPLPAVCQFMKLGPIQLALLEYRVPERQDVPRPMNRLGIANFAFTVETLDPVIERVEAHGGHVHRETLLNGPQGTFVHCSDPDGAHRADVHAGRIAGKQIRPSAGAGFGGEMAFRTAVMPAGRGRRSDDEPRRRARERSVPNAATCGQAAARRYCPPAWGRHSVGRRCPGDILMGGGRFRRR